MATDFGYRGMSATKSKVSGVIDVSLTRNHHNYYGEEEDPGLARLLARANKQPGDADNESDDSSEAIDLTATAIEVPGTTRPTRSNPPVIAAENVQIINEGDDAEDEEGSEEEDNANATENESVCALSAATPRSINLRADRDEISSPMSVSVRDNQAARVRVTDHEQRLPPSHDSARSERTARSIDVSVENVGYERLEDQTTTSIPAQPSLRVFRGIHEDATFENGEDSDGEIGPFLDAVEHEASIDELYDEQPQLSVESEIETTNNNLLPPPPFTNDELKKMKVSELKALLTERRLRTAGLKNALVHRLSESYKSTATPLGENELQAPEGFPATSRWKQLIAETEPVNLPPSRFRNPTQMDVTTPTKKYDYAEEWNRNEYEEMNDVFTFDRQGSIKLTRDGSPMVEKAVHKKGRPKVSWLEEHNLGPSAHPVEWLDAMLSRKQRSYEQRKNKKREWVSVMSDWKNYTNLKASLCHAGVKIYKYWKEFTTLEIRRFVGLYVLDGVCPSPRVSMKFRPQSEDPVNGNDLCNEMFGSNADNRLKMFKCFFACQDPRLSTPSKKSHPNFKIDPFFLHLLQCFSRMWDLGAEISYDEATQGFKGRHYLKAKIKYKKAGDGYLIDCVGDDGFIFTFYQRTNPAPKKWTDMGFSPTQARVLFLFDQLPGKYYTCYLDNLFMSARLCRMAYVKLDSKVMMHGVTRASGRGLPEFVVQKEVSGVSQKEAVIGTLKAAVLNGDDECPALIACSVYDSKPVHFLSTAAKEIKWLTKDRKVYDYCVEDRVDMKFLRTNMQEMYNYGMNKIDLGDQYRGQYKMDYWKRQSKWWMALWLFGLQVCVVNAFVAYTAMCTHLYNMKKKEMLTHYEFQKYLALALIDPDGWGPHSENWRMCVTKKGRGTAYANEFQALERGVSKKPKAERINDATLDPVIGKLRNRIVFGGPDNLRHLPVQCDLKEPVCALHRYAHGRDNSEGKVRAQCMWCDDCQVVLCIKCFHLFHTVKNPKQLKAEVVRQTKITTTIKTAKAKVNRANVSPAKKRKNPAVARRLHRKRR